MNFLLSGKIQFMFLSLFSFLSFCDKNRILESIDLSRRIKIFQIYVFLFINKNAFMREKIPFGQNKEISRD